MHQLVAEVYGFDAAVASLDESNVALGQVRRLAGWLESRRLAIVSRISELSPVPEEHVARSSRTSQRAAMKTAKRAATAAAHPVLASALASGAVSGEHVDAVSRALSQLEPAHREQFAQQLGSFLPLALLGTRRPRRHAHRHHNRRRHDHRPTPNKRRLTGATHADMPVPAPLARNRRGAECD